MTLVIWAEDAAVTNLLPDLSCLKKVCKASLLIKETTVVKPKAQHRLHHQKPSDTQHAVFTLVRNQFKHKYEYS